MPITYEKLFALLQKKNMKKSDLREIIAPKTVAKLSKGEWISGEVIEKICEFLDCQPGDIMTFVKNPTIEEVYQAMYKQFEMFHDKISFDEFCAIAKKHASKNETVFNQDEIIRDVKELYFEKMN